IDPACGSGHFLLYAFDVLERIWWAETDLDRGEIPAKILEHNLHGVDIDLRSCQLSAFNLYLKARTRAEAEGDDFEMPNVGIVCADARVAEVEQAADVLDDIAVEGTEVREALGEIIREFQTTEALGSLLEVQETLSDEFVDGQTDILEWGGDGPHTLNAFLKQLRAAVEERTADSFGEQNLRSFLHLLVVLTQDYDVALMNPPYGSGGRMPDDVQDYVEDHYEYTTEYYINFFEACDRLVETEGRIGMLVPWSFMFNKSFQQFREDFVGDRGSFDFFSEFGYDVLDNATVGTVGTVVRSDAESDQTGTFVRLPDVAKADKERSFLHAAFVDATEDGVRRRYERDLSEFDAVPGTPLSYWVPTELRSIYDASSYLDAEKGGVDGDSLGEVSAGLCTGDDGRFVREFWEAGGDGNWVPFAKGGSDAFLLPRVNHVVDWKPREMASQPGGRVQNTDDYFSEALSYTVAKRSGRRFGYLHPSSIFSHKGSVVIPDRAIWNVLSYTNSHLFTYLMLTQTSERMWEIGFVSKVPWREELADVDELERLSREAVGHLVSKRQYDFVSPHYDGPILLDVLGIDDPLPQYDH
ncbi:BREX-5 system adenine-specific DNA-methyltransferase PglX, partial [Halorussus salinisoli]|uniref:BREX-5 system adenine-specific DNA-methyltransferase PglX n=1 Tax=Halorussus salinisoli TaxID=2558242 RepID=UPI0010C18B22